MGLHSTCLLSSGKKNNGLKAANGRLFHCLCITMPHTSAAFEIRFISLQELWGDTWGMNLYIYIYRPGRQLFNVAGNPVGSWRQPLRVDGPKASQRSIITHKIHFCTDQAKTHREGRFWFDLSYDVTGVHRQMLRIKFCWFLFVFWWKLSHWDLVYKMAGCAARVT